MKNSEDLHAPMGYFDEAKNCELVGFSIFKLNKIIIKS